VTGLTPSADQFIDVTEPFLRAHPGVTRSTMMGLPCVRIDGVFFVSWDRITGRLLVKLPASRVEELVTSEVAESFAPAGRRFREWAAINPADDEVWMNFVEEALTFVRNDVDLRSPKKGAPYSERRSHR
jgi:hypothetical protein